MLTKSDFLFLIALVIFVAPAAWAAWRIFKHKRKYNLDRKSVVSK